VENEHRRLLARKSIIEKRKEDLERQILEKEKEEESKRVSIQIKNANDERIRLLNEQRQREQERIRREIEEKNKAEAKKLLEDLTKKAGKKHVVVEGELTKEAIMELALSEQLKERQEMEKKLQKLAKTMDYLERAKRQEEAPLIDQAFQKRLEEEKILHEQEQLREIELSKQHHAGDLQEKNRLSRMLEHKNAFQDRIVQRREAEFGRLKKERDERISQVISSRKRERETVRKLMYYLNLEEQRIERCREEEEARKREEEEKRKREEAERKAKLDAIAAKQRQREIELEEKEKARKEQLLRGSEATRVTDSAPVAQPPREPAAPAVAVAATIAPAAGKYVPKFKRGDSSSSSAGGSQRPADVRTRDEDRWGSREERPRPDVRPLRQDGPPARQDAPPARPDGPPPATDRWRGSRFSSSSSTSSSTWGRPRN
jgi:translation initiation factor 3 subunit A